MELNQLRLLLACQGVESSGFEAREGVVARSEDGHTVVGVVELADEAVRLAGSLE